MLPDVLFTNLVTFARRFGEAREHVERQQKAKERQASIAALKEKQKAAKQRRASAAAVVQRDPTHAAGSDKAGEPDALRRRARDWCVLPRARFARSRPSSSLSARR